VSGPGRRGSSIATRLLLAQGAVLAAAAGAAVLAAAVVGPPLFHEHLTMADHRDEAGLLAHADEAFRWAGTISLVTGLAIAAVVALGVSVLLNRRVGRSLASLSAAAERVAEGDYAAPVDTRGAGAEIESLAVSFGTMADRLATTEATRRRLLTDVAHEMRTPVASIDAVLEGIEDGVLPPDRATVATLREQTARLSRLAADLRDVSAAEEGRLDLHRRPLAATDLVARARLAWADAYARAGVALRASADGAGGALVDADPDRVAQVLGNLLSNALRHTPPGGEVHLSAATVDGGVRLQVSDTGDGIAAEHLPHVLERFYRTDTARDRDHGGTGVGLAISAAIARAHGGTLAAASDGPGRGATFTLVLPLAAGR
jgi:signal transduction histidine kinase